MQAKGLPGFRDFYPADIALLHHIFAAWRTVCARYGFEEYDGPPLEPLDLYTRKSGEEIVEQLYHFDDKGGRSVALRPEMTPTLARMVAAKASDFKKPIRWYSIPHLFRYERQQRGRLREHFQLNMDLIGESGPLADAEVIAAAIDIMRELGLGADAVRVRLSDRQMIRALLLDAGLDESQRPVLEFPGRHPLGMNVGNLLQLQGTFRGDGEVDSSGYVVEVVLIFQLLTELDKLALVPVQNSGYFGAQVRKLGYRFIEGVNHGEGQKIEYGQLREE